MENELVEQVDEIVVEDAPQTETEIDTEEVDSAPEEEQQENPENKAEEKPKDEYSKKARKAIKFREKLISKERQKNEQLAQQLNEMRAEIEAIKSGKQAVDSKPKQEDFSTWEDYNEALADWKVEQKLKDFKAEQTKAAEPKPQDAKELRIQERTQVLRQNAEELSKSIPDFAQVLNEYGDEMDEMPASHVELILELDDAAAALYVLAKEDRLERLADMPLNLAAAELIRARDKASQFVAPKQTITKAPPPVNGARGVGGTTRKSTSDMSAKDLIKWAQS